MADVCGCKFKGSSSAEACEKQNRSISHSFSAERSYHSNGKKQRQIEQLLPRDRLSGDYEERKKSHNSQQGLKKCERLSNMSNLNQKICKRTDSFLSNDKKQMLPSKMCRSFESNRRYLKNANVSSSFTRGNSSQQNKSSFSRNPCTKKSYNQNPAGNQTLKVSNLDTLVIQPGYPTVIEVHSSPSQTKLKKSQAKDSYLEIPEENCICGCSWVPEAGSIIVANRETMSGFSKQSQTEHNSNRKEKRSSKVESQEVECQEENFKKSSRTTGSFIKNVEQGGNRRASQLAQPCPDSCSNEFKKSSNGKTESESNRRQISNGCNQELSNQNSSCGKNRSFGNEYTIQSNRKESQSNLEVSSSMKQNESADNNLTNQLLKVSNLDTVIIQPGSPTLIEVRQCRNKFEQGEPDQQNSYQLVSKSETKTEKENANGKQAEAQNGDSQILKTCKPSSEIGKSSSNGKREKPLMPCKKHGWEKNNTRKNSDYFKNQAQEEKNLCPTASNNEQPPKPPEMTSGFVPPQKQSKPVSRQVCSNLSYVQPVKGASLHPAEQQTASNSSKQTRVPQKNECDNRMSQTQSLFIRQLEYEQQSQYEMPSQYQPQCAPPLSTPQNSSLAPQNSPLAPQNSPLAPQQCTSPQSTPQNSPLAPQQCTSPQSFPQNSPLAPQQCTSPQSTPQNSPLAPQCSSTPPTPQNSLMTPQCSSTPPTPQNSLLTAQQCPSSLTTPNSQLAPQQCSSPPPQQYSAPPQQFTQPAQQYSLPPQFLPLSQYSSPPQQYSLPPHQYPQPQYSSPPPGSMSPSPRQVTSTYSPQYQPSPQVDYQNQQSPIEGTKSFSKRGCSMEYTTYQLASEHHNAYQSQYPQNGYQSQPPTQYQPYPYQSSNNQAQSYGDSHCQKELMPRSSTTNSQMQHQYEQSPLPQYQNNSNIVYADASISLEGDLQQQVNSYYNTRNDTTQKCAPCNVHDQSGNYNYNGYQSDVYDEPSPEYCNDCVYHASV